MGTFVLDATGFRCPEDFDRALAAEVMAPFPFSGWNAHRSVLNNLEWFGNEVGCILVVHGTDAWVAEWPDGFETFTCVVADASRRWQHIGNAFHVVFLGGDAAAAETVLRDELPKWPDEFNVTVSRYEA